MHGSLYMQAGGPRWSVLLGRRDGTTTNVQSARNLPNFFDPLSVLQEKFRNVNLDDTDLVALQGNQSTSTYRCSNTNSSSLRKLSMCLLTNLNIFVISTPFRSAHIWQSTVPVHAAELHCWPVPRRTGELGPGHTQGVRQQILQQPFTRPRSAPVRPGYAIGPFCSDNHCSHCSSVRKQPTGLLQKLRGIHD